MLLNVYVKICSFIVTCVLCFGQILKQQFLNYLILKSWIANISKTLLLVCGAKYVTTKSKKEMFDSTIINAHKLSTFRLNFS